MGRTQDSYAPMAQQGHRKDQRAKRARLIINKTIPQLLASDARARNGVASAELIVDAQRSNEAQKYQDGGRENQERRKKHSKQLSRATASEDEATNIHTAQTISTEHRARRQVRVSISVCDTLSAAKALSQAIPKSKCNVAVLNMASLLRPGGGVRNGATSQEETLCVRTTLLPSLREEWYRLPELGGIWSPDVLVFGDKADDKTSRFYIDVITSGMMRLPDLTEKPLPKSKVDAEDSEMERQVVEHVYASSVDRETAIHKVRALLRILESKGAERIVLGAWGCGAYGNPVGEIVKAFRRVLLGNNKKRHTKNIGSVNVPEWPSFREIVFAIKDSRMATSFAQAWGDDIEVVYSQERKKTNTSIGDEPDEIEKRDRKELQERIMALEMQIERAQIPLLKDRLGSVVTALRAQLNALKLNTNGREGNDLPELEETEEHDELPKPGLGTSSEEEYNDDEDGEDSS